MEQGGWVLSLVMAELVLQFGPALGAFSVVVGGVGFVVHLESLADGAHCVLN